MNSTTEAIEQALYARKRDRSRPSVTTTEVLIAWIANDAERTTAFIEWLTANTSQ